MFHQVLRHCLNAANNAPFIFRLFKGSFHREAYLLPFLRTHFCVYPAIGNDFHVPVGEQQINQQAVIVFGVPHSQF